MNDIDMSERDPLLSSSADNSFNRFTNEINRVENLIKDGYRNVMRKIHAREFLAEFLATFILVTVGNGAIAQTVLSKTANGTFLTVNIGYGIGLMIGAYIAGGITGAHMNPAVTLAMAMRGKTSWIKVVPYWIAQFLGAFLSAAVVYGVYVDAIVKFNGLDINNQPIKYCFVNGTRPEWTYTPEMIPKSKLPLCTGGIFATYPAPHLSYANGVLDQVFGTFLLVLGIFAICDSQNNEVKAGLKPLMIGFLLWAIGGSFGFNCGYAVNPARDFSPRLFTAMAGWGSDAFTCSQCPFKFWWLIPLFAPMVGGAIAAPFYWFFIEANHPPLQEDDVGTVQGKRTMPPSVDYET